MMEDQYMDSAYLSLKRLDKNGLTSYSERCESIRPDIEDGKFFMLRIDKDVHARQALYDYAVLIQPQDPERARHLMKWLAETPFKP